MKILISNARTKLALAAMTAVLFAIGIAGSAWAQTNPAAQTLPYTQNFSGLASTTAQTGAWSDPALVGWQGWTAGTTIAAAFPTAAPTANQDLIASSSASNAAGGNHNYDSKLGELGSGTVSPAIALALNTTGQSNIAVSYDVMTIRNRQDGTNNVVGEVGLQYRVGTTGPFLTLPSTAYQNLTGLANNKVTAGDVTPQNLQTRTITLPPVCDNQATVQIRWVVRDAGGSNSLGRPGFAIDNVNVTGSAPSIPAAPPNLVGRWRMEEGSGSTILDASGNGLNGSTVNSPTWVTPSMEGTYALNMPNTGSSSIYASVPHNAALNMSGNQLTVAAWIRPTTTGTMQVISKEAFTTNLWGYSLVLSSNSPFKVFFRLDNNTAGAGRLDSYNSYPSDGSTWMHVAATYDGATMKLYVNGVLDASQARAVSVPQNTQPLAIGSNSIPETGRMFRGAIDDARVYNRALSDTEIRALVGMSTHTITASAGANGSISPSGAVTVNDAANQPFTFTPVANYHVSALTVDGGSVAVAPNYTFSSVTVDHTIDVQFAIDTHTLTYTAGPNGSISGTTPQTVNHGADGTPVTAVPAGGYHFTSWSDGVLTATRTDTNVIADLSVTANFAINTYTLTYTAGPNGSITGTSPQTVPYGGNGTLVTAVPGTGYHFVDWSDGVLTAVRTDMNVTGDVTVTANFAINTYTLTYNAGPNGSIVGTNPQTVPYGGNGTQVTATPSAGYHFLSWSDAYATAARTDMNVTADLTVTANFEADAPTNTSVVNVGPAPGLITQGDPIRTVPVTISRTDLTALKAFSVVFSVSPPVNVNGGMAGIHQGTYLSNANSNTSFNLIDKGLDGFGNHSYQADGAILGSSPCGSSAASGTLFTIDLSSAAASGSGTVTITSLKLRDCSNIDLPWMIGTSSTVSIDQSAPSVSVTVPNGGELWHVGSSQNITWTGSDPEGVASYDLAYSTDGGASYPNAIATVPGTASSYAWTIPATPGTTARVRATAHDVNGNIAADASNANFTIAYYTLTYAAGAGGTIVGTSPQSVAYGGNGTLVTATPNLGYHFVSWSDGYPTAARTDLNVTADVNATANFAIDTFTLAYAAGPNGSLTGTTSQTVPYGGSGTPVTAVPAATYHFVNWSDGSTANPRTDTNVTANISVTANFAIDSFTLAYAAGPNGSLTGTTSQTVPYGGSGTPVTAVPAATYHFVNWSDGSTANPRTDTNVTANISVTANFAIDSFTLAYAAGPNGSLTGTTSQTVPYGGSGTPVTAVPAATYHFVNWSDGSTANPRTDTNVTANISVTANFAIDSFTLAYAAGPNGSLTGTTSQTVPYGGSGTPVTAVPAATYHFVNWSDGSTANPRTDTNVTANISVTANFAIDSFTLAYAAGPNGSLTGTTSQTVPYGGSGTPVTAVPAATYHFVNWSDGSTANPRTDTNVTANISVTANFAIDSFTLAYAAGPNGSLTGTTSQTVPYGGSGTPVTAVPAATYHFVNWSDGSTANPRTDTNVTANISVTANFAIDSFTLAYAAGPNGSLTGTTSQTVPYGGSGTPVTAVPAATYHFVNWSDGSTANPRTDTNVTANISVTANFAIDSFTLAYAAGPNGSLTGTTSQTVPYGGSGTPVTAVPAATYHFVNWSDGSTANPRTDTNVTANISVTANFAISTFTLTYTAGAGGTIAGTSPQTVPYGGNGTPVTATPNSGFHFVSWSDSYPTAARTDMNVTADINATATFAANPAVAAVANLAATQIRPGTLNQETTPIQVSWNATPAGTTVEVWRKGFGSYPEYDDGGGVTPTASASYPPGAGWVQVAGLVSGGSDLVATRDFYFYVAYAQDGFGTWSPASSLTAGTLNYHLGDVSNGGTPGTGNNKVFTEDISLLGTNYGKTGIDVNPVNYLDVGPTTTLFVDGRPTTDNHIDFEDLVMFAINYGLGQTAPPATPLTAIRAATTATAATTVTADEASLEAPEHVTLGQTVTARLSMRGTGAVIAVSARLAWDPAVVEPVSHTIGDWLAKQDGQAFSARPGTVDAAVMRSEGMTGEGELATVTFRVLSAGDPKLKIEALDARDAHNRGVGMMVTLKPLAPVIPATTSLAFARPNPFRSTVAIPFSLSARGPVALELYSVDGRRVRTLVNETREPGEYEVVWDGRDDNGNEARAGVYFVRLATPQGRFSRTITNLK